jgi:hypothetical protein
LALPDRNRRWFGSSREGMFEREKWPRSSAFGEWSTWPDAWHHKVTAKRRSVRVTTRVSPCRPAGLRRVCRGLKRLSLLLLKRLSLLLVLAPCLLLLLLRAPVLAPLPDGIGYGGRTGHRRAESQGGRGRRGGAAGKRRWLGVGRGPREFRSACVATATEPAGWTEGRRFAGTLAPARGGSMPRTRKIVGQ